MTWRGEDDFERDHGVPQSGNLPQELGQPGE